jgi:hypothetical protein
MKISGRYSPGLYAGVTGFLLLVGINAFSISTNIKQASERSRLTAEAELELTKAQTAKKIADAYAQNGVANFHQLIINNYTLSTTPPRFDWQRSVDPARKTFIYDKNRLCVGYALNGKFYFVLYYTGVCNGTRSTYNNK